jgi:hypothetical protein
MAQLLNSAMAQLSAILILFSNAIYAQSETISKNVNGIKFTITVFDYGIGVSDDNSKEIDTSSPTLNYFHGDQFIVTQKTDHITAQKNLKFGLNYSVSTNIDSAIDIVTVWVFPKPIFNPHLEKRFPSLARTHEIYNSYNGYACYIFEQYFEMEKGEWQFRLYYNNELLYSKSFWVE